MKRIEFRTYDELAESVMDICGCMENFAYAIVAYLDLLDNGEDLEIFKHEKSADDVMYIELMYIWLAYFELGGY